MEPVTYVASTTASSSPTVFTPIGVDIFSIVGGLFTGSDSSDGFSSGGIINFFSSLWGVIAILSYIVCIILLSLYIFSSIRRNLYLGLMTQDLRDQEKMYEELYGGPSKNNRLKDVFIHAESDNPSDWKLAIIEADIILDETLKKKGFVGSSLGDRLRSIQPQQLSSLDDAWEAHKVRNRIAHDGADFVLTKRIVDETIGKYQRVFNEFGLN